MKIIQAPNDLPYRDHTGPTNLFLAGSIEMEKADDWQERVIDDLKNYDDDCLTIFNPRREDFDISQPQSINNAYFSKQVNWELNALDLADYVFMYFDPNTKSPITLMELGLHADNFAKLVVVCPDGFYRQANVEIVCQRYEIPFMKDIKDGIVFIRDIIDCDHHLNGYD